MKKALMLLFACYINLSDIVAQSFGVGVNTPDASSIMELRSTSKGVLLPRLSTGQRDAITGLGAAQEGLLIYNSNTDLFNFWNGIAWVVVPAPITGSFTWFNESTATGASNTTSDMYRTGTVGIGLTNVDFVVSPLHVKAPSILANHTVTIDNDFAKSGLDINLSGTVSAGVTSGINIDNSNIGIANKFGIYNALRGGGTGNIVGIRNWFLPTSTYANYVTGTSNEIDITVGDGIHTGTSNILSGEGDGTHYGTTNNLSGIGVGIKYGTYNYINPTAGGIHYGLFSSVTKATGWAGYFLGRVYIGTNTTNGYNFPGVDGTANYVMQTDGSGQVSWANPASFGTPDADWFQEGTTSPPTLITADIFRSGDVGIGITVPTARLHVNGTTIPFRVSIGGVERMRFNNRTLELINTEFGTFVGENAGIAVTGLNNTAIGYNALDATTSGAGNVAIGSQALTTNTTLSNLVAIGFEALRANTTGTGNLAIGAAALDANTTGINNIAIGESTLTSQTTLGNYNVAIGYQALMDNTGGDGNIAIGNETLSNNTVTNHNIAIGSRALNGAMTAGGQNIGIGYETLMTATTSYNNVAIGITALTSNTTGINNIAIGYDALGLVTTGENNIAIGNIALQEHTGNNTIAIGFNALANNTTGLGNTALGYQALTANITGGQSTAIGNNTLASFNSTNGRNTAVGFQALMDATTALDNVAVGALTLSANISGQDNTAIGLAALNRNTTGSGNTIVGEQAFENNLTGSFNTAVGWEAGTINAGSGNVFIGNQAGGLTVGVDNSLFIDNSNTSTPLIYGEFDNDIARINGQFQVTADVGIGNPLPTHKVDIVHNSSGTDGHIRLAETLANDGARIHFENAIETTNTWTLYGRADNTAADNIFNIFHSGTGNIVTSIGDGVDGKVGIAGRVPTTNALEVEGTASKTVAGAWLANSDERLKKNIVSMDSEAILQKILIMRGVTYEWNDDKTGYNRPQGIQYGFIAQDLQKIWPTKVSEDADGYLQTAYSDYDAMFVEAFKAQQAKINALQQQNETLANQLNQQHQTIETLQSSVEKLLKVIDTAKD
jgi:hypothetical protein